MASRRKKLAAEERTVGLFTGLTNEEEKLQSKLLEEEERDDRAVADRSYQGTKDATMRSVVQWLGFDDFEDGDDIMVAVGPRGGAVICIVYGGKGRPVRRTVEARLSPKLWSKLKDIARGA